MFRATEGRLTACMAHKPKQQLNLKVCFDCSSSSLVYGHYQVDDGYTKNIFYLSTNIRGCRRNMLLLNRSSAPACQQIVGTVKSKLKIKVCFVKFNLISGECSDGTPKLLPGKISATIERHTMSHRLTRDVSSKGVPLIDYQRTACRRSHVISDVTMTNINSV